MSQGGVDGGFTFFVQGNRLRYTYNYVAEQQFQVVSEVEVPTGKHVLSFEFEPTGEPEPLKGKERPASPSCSSTANPPARASSR